MFYHGEGFWVHLVHYSLQHQSFVSLNYTFLSTDVLSSAALFNSAAVCCFLCLTELLISALTYCDVSLSFDQIPNPSMDLLS